MSTASSRTASRKARTSVCAGGGGGVGDRRGERLQGGPGDRAERSADKDRDQFAAVVTEHEPQYGGNSPDSGHRPRSGEQNR